MLCLWKKFNDSIFGHTVTIETDHQPRVSIFNKPIHASPVRLQRMLLQLKKYDIVLIHKRGQDMHLADTVARAPQKTCEDPPSPDDDFVVMTVSFIHSSCMEDLVAHTAADSTLRLLTSVIKRGWPDKHYNVPLSVRPFFAVRDELVLQEGIVLKGHKWSLLLCTTSILTLSTQGTQALKPPSYGQEACFTGLVWLNTSPRWWRPVHCATAWHLTNKSNHFFHIWFLHSRGLQWQLSYLIGMASSTWYSSIRIQDGLTLIFLAAPLLAWWFRSYLAIFQSTDLQVYCYLTTAVNLPANTSGNLLHAGIFATLPVALNIQ